MIPTTLQAVTVTSPAPRMTWSRLAAADPTAFPTQLPQWVDAASSARGLVDASRLYSLEDGRELLLPLAARTTAGVSLTVESYPYGWGYGGLLTDGGKVSFADAALVFTDLSHRPVVRSAVVPMPLSASVWSAAASPNIERVPYLTHIIDLAGGFDVVWRNGYKKSTRNLVRKAGRLSLEVRREHGGPIVSTFGGMYRQSVKRWARQRGQPAAAASLWARYQDRPGQVAAVSASMGKMCVFWSAWRAGEPVAVLIVLQHGQHAMSWLTAIDRQLADDTLATYLLQSLAIEEACSRGALFFHLGETDAGSGVELYKTKFGAAPVHYDAYRMERVPLTRAERRLRQTAHVIADRRRRLRSGAGGGPVVVGHKNTGEHQ